MRRATCSGGKLTNGQLLAQWSIIPFFIYWYATIVYAIFFFQTRSMAYFFFLLSLSAWMVRRTTLWYLRRVYICVCMCLVECNQVKAAAIMYRKNERRKKKQKKCAHTRLNSKGLQTPFLFDSVSFLLQDIPLSLCYPSLPTSLLQLSLYCFFFFLYLDHHVFCRRNPFYVYDTGKPFFRDKYVR